MGERGSKDGVASTPLTGELKLGLESGGDSCCCPIVASLIEDLPYPLSMLEAEEAESQGGRGNIAPSPLVGLHIGGGGGGSGSGLRLGTAVVTLGGGGGRCGE